MTGRRATLPLIFIMLVLPGCVAGMAAGALGMAVRGSQGQQDNAHLGPAAVRACTALAAQYGNVNIIDVEQRPNRLIVWGSVGEGEQRRSFECAFRDRVTNLEVREIAPRR